MTTPPPEPPAAAPLDNRVSKIEAEQERQGGVLDKIVGMLADAPDSNTTVTRADEPPAAAATDMTEQMRQAIRDVSAEAAAAGKQEPASPPAETTPREVMIRGKERLQRALFGSDPK